MSNKGKPQTTVMWVIIVFFMIVCLNVYVLWQGTHQHSATTDRTIERIRVTQAVAPETETGMLIVYRVLAGYERRVALTDARVPIYTEHNHMFDDELNYSMILSKLSLKHDCFEKDIAIQKIYRNVKR